MKQPFFAAVICLIAFLFCACAGNQPTAPSETNAPEPTAEPTEAAFSAAEAEIRQFPVDPRHLPIRQQVLQVNGAEFVLLRRLSASLPHAHQ